LDYFKSIHTMLRSPSIAKGVIQKLNLEESEEFQKEYSPISLSKHLSSFIYQMEHQIQSILTTMGISENFPETGSETNNIYPSLVRKFLRKLTISPISGSHVVQIKFEGFSPELITKITNIYIDTFILKNNELRNSILGESGDWMEARLNELKENIKVSELALQNFVKSKNIIEFKNERNAAYQNLQKYNDEVSATKKDSLEAKVLINILWNL